VLSAYGLPGSARLTPVSGGHINQSWKVAPEIAGRGESYLLQRLNPLVFQDGEGVMRNLAHVSAHLQRAAGRLGLSQPERRLVRLVPTAVGAPAVQAADGAWWRLVYFIEGTRVWDQADTVALAREAGTAFGLFQRMLADYAGPPLAETIPGFHDTAARLEQLDRAAVRDHRRRGAVLESELAFVRERAGYAAVLPPLLAGGDLPTRVVHNDAKISNVLLDEQTGEGLAVIDLDTVMSGTLLHDVGDLIRSTASPTAEDERDLSRITVRLPFIAGLAEGFLRAGGAELTEAERGLFAFAGILITFEQGVRFLTDHLAGDAYYRIARAGQNLDRCRAQFRLVERLEERRGDIERTIGRIGVTGER